MKEYLKGLDPQLKEMVKIISQQAAGLNMTVYIVGGVVRDLLLERNVSDLDLVVEGDAIELAEQLAKKLEGKLVCYSQFKTATLHFTTGQRLDLATARKEEYSVPGALPKVSSGDIRDDLFRRDFTVNAMAICVSLDRFGELVDFWGGREDLAKKKIRILHDLSFVDDPTRILRAIRFEGRLKFTIEAKTLGFIKNALGQGMIHRVKAPRFFSEFKKILMEDHFALMLRRFDELLGVAYFLPKVKINFKSLQTFEGRIHNLRKNKGFQLLTQWWLIVFSYLLKDATTVRVNQFLVRFQVSKYEQDVVWECRKVGRVINRLKSPRLKRSETYRLLKTLKHDTLLYILAVAEESVVVGRIDGFLLKDSHLRTQINGHDLGRLGLKDGKKTGRILDKVLDARIDGLLRSKFDEIRFVKKLLLKEG